VKVAEGCDNRCTYCAIPLIRGPLASREPPEIIREIRELLERGAREIILIAQDLGSFGKDRDAPGLPGLLEEIAAIPGRFQVRLLYIHPDHFPREILGLPARDERFLPYYDIPFQHASPGILRAMGRRDDPARNLDLVAEIRARVGRAAIRSTLLVGFPGESPQDFDRLLRFQEDARLDWLGIFTYSREDDTPAARMGGRVKGSEARSRKAALEARQVPITESALDGWVGRTIDVLVEERVEGESLCLGRGPLQAPDVDGLVVLRGVHVAGSLVRARIFRRNGFDLEAAPVGEAGAGA
jgi:ribosomal protein S12 methylthiotransferase